MRKVKKLVPGTPKPAPQPAMPKHRQISLRPVAGHAGAAQVRRPYRALSLVFAVFMCLLAGLLAENYLYLMKNEARRQEREKLNVVTVVSEDLSLVKAMDEEREAVACLRRFSLEPSKKNIKLLNLAKQKLQISLNLNPGRVGSKRASEINRTILELGKLISRVEAEKDEAEKSAPAESKGEPEAQAGAASGGNSQGQQGGAE